MMEVAGLLTTAGITLYSAHVILAYPPLSKVAFKAISFATQ